MRYQMRRMTPLLLLAAAAALLPVRLGVAQVIGADPLLAAREEVIAELVQELPASLPAGALALLPPEVAAPARVDRQAAESWPVAFAAALQDARPAIVLTDRSHLEAILREQKFGDSAYADPLTATTVGRLVAARMLLMTRIAELQQQGSTVRVSLEATLVDVETGTILWSHTTLRGILPLWIKLLIVVAILVIAPLLGLLYQHHRRTRRVRRDLPRAKAEVRIDCDGLAAAAAKARERLHTTGATAAAQAVHRAWTELDSTLEQVRHALPGGAVDRNRLRDLDGALREAGRLAVILEELRELCDGCGDSADAGEALAGRLHAGETEVRTVVDAFRRHMV